MAVSQLLMRGMLVGLVAGILAFAVAYMIGESSVDRAIAFESAAHQAHDHGVVTASGADEEPEVVSRAVQSTIGLATGTLVVGVAFGGLFGLVYALCYGRFGVARPRTFAALLGLTAFVAICLVPMLKYPANPPSVGLPHTIGLRTGLYVSMIVLSIVATIAAFSLRRILLPVVGSWHAGIAAGLTFIVLVAIACTFLPVIDEVPYGFPAQTLWSFRLASLAIEACLWAVIGLLFGTLTELRLTRRGEPRGLF